MSTTKRWTPRTFAELAQHIPLRGTDSPRLVWVTNDGLHRLVDAYNQGALDMFQHPLPEQPLILGFEPSLTVSGDATSSVEMLVIEDSRNLQRDAVQMGIPRDPLMCDTGRIVGMWTLGAVEELGSFLTSEFGGSAECGMERLTPAPKAMPVALGGDPLEVERATLISLLHRVIGIVWAGMNEPQAQEDAALSVAAERVSVGKKRQRWSRDISVVDIRRVRGVRHAPSGRQIEHDHRWVRDGHWRDQACGPRHSLRKRIWIDEVICGPADKPLIRRTKVQRLR